MKKHLSFVSMLVVVMLLVSSFATVAFAGEGDANKCGQGHEDWSAWEPETAKMHSRYCETCLKETGTTQKVYRECEFIDGVCVCGNRQEGSGDAEVCEHDYKKKTVEPTCTEGGYTKYTCTKCGDSFKKNKTGKLSHWYAEWTPNGDDTHSANCKREGCKHVGTVDCETFEYVLNGTAIVFCPVCGEVENGTHLDLIEDAEAASEALPKGELVLRANGELMSVGYEFSGKLTQPTEPMTITLPAEIVNGYTLSILAADGTETALATTAEGETVSFTLDFGETPVVLIHMA